MAYDYVLAGGGSAGATLAARLSEDHKITVCLIEAGGEGRSVVAEATSRAARRWADRARSTA